MGLILCSTHWSINTAIRMSVKKILCRWKEKECKLYYLALKTEDYLILRTDCLLGERNGF